MNDKKVLQRTTAVYTTREVFKRDEGGVVNITRNEDGEVLVFFGKKGDPPTERVVILPLGAIERVDLELMDPPMVQPAMFVPKVHQ